MVTGVLGLVKSDVSVSILVVDLSNKILETNVGGGIGAIIGEFTHLNIRRSVSVVHGALPNV